MNQLRTVGIIIIVFGGLLLMVGLMFAFFKWPDMFKGIYAGLGFILIGIILFLYSKRKSSKQE